MQTNKKQLKHVNYLWDDEVAAKLDPVERLVYRSNILGQDQHCLGIAMATLITRPGSFCKLTAVTSHTEMADMALLSHNMLVSS